VEDRPAWLAILGHWRRRLGLARRQNFNSSSRPEHPSANSSLACELCLRESVRYTVHHLVPRSRGGKFGPKAKLCPTCHRQLHAQFSESTLAREFDSIDRIKAHPEMAEYLNWVQKQKGLSNFRVRRANNRR